MSAKIWNIECLIYFLANTKVDLTKEGSFGGFGLMNWTSRPLRNRLKTEEMTDKRKVKVCVIFSGKRIRKDPFLLDNFSDNETFSLFSMENHKQIGKKKISEDISNFHQ